MSNNNGVPQPPYNPDGVPQPRYATDQDQYRQYQPGQTEALPTQSEPTQAYPAQQPYAGQPGYAARPGMPGNPGPGNHNKKALFLILGGIAVVVVIALVVVFAWLIPSVAKPVAVETATPTAEASYAASDASTEAEPSEEPSSSSDIPSGAIPLPAGWDQLAGPSNVPADGDPLFSKWVTGESSFQYLAEWTHDESFGITKDPSTGEEIQKKAQGTTETDGDGIALAYAFFAESEEGKFGKDPEKVKAAIKDIEARYQGMTATELPQNLVGHKCASDFKTTMPEIREFRRGAAVVVGFTCTNARGEEIQAVNLFSVTPWGTPQMLGVSGHKEYWDAHPGLFQQLANSYRINKWKVG
ncbi:MAG TPA: hypothetical protein VJQ60_06695 [Arthrobacter sp.]|nr:hypothetical protein [Arthrobacter sp.]